MGLFDRMYVSRIQSAQKKRPKKKTAVMTLLTVATGAQMIASNSGCLDLSHFTIPSEQVYALSIDMESNY